nr:autorepressor SdpR family transcription factor [uncultured Sellimonas sp.]
MTSVFKALSDDTRRQILKLLTNGDMTAKEIAENFEISKPAISKHLDVLKEAKLVTSERTGMSVTYSLNASVLQTTLGAFLEFFDTDHKEAKKGENEDENKDI